MDDGLRQHAQLRASALASLTRPRAKCELGRRARARTRPADKVVGGRGGEEGQQQGALPFLPRPPLRSFSQTRVGSVRIYSCFLRARSLRVSSERTLGTLSSQGKSFPNCRFTTPPPPPPWGSSSPPPPPFGDFLFFL